MSTDSPANDRPARRVPLPSPGVAAVMTLVVILFGVTLSIWWPYHWEQRVLAEINARPGIEARADYVFVGPGVLSRYADRDWMKWFGRVEELEVTGSSSPPTSASLSTTGPTATGLPRLEPLRRFTVLRVTDVSLIDDRFLRGAVSCSHLRTIGFHRCTIERNGLRGLDGHPGVIEITMTRISVDDDVLELPHLPSLRSFRGDGARFRQLDVSGTPSLRRVEAKNCGFSDEGVEMLVAAPHLDVLMFPGGRLTDAAIDDLLEFRSLRFLDLRFNSQVTRPALERLAELPQLRSVNVYKTGVEEELNELQKRLPQARSHWDQL